MLHTPASHSACSVCSIDTYSTRYDVPGQYWNIIHAIIVQVEARRSDSSGVYDPAFVPTSHTPHACSKLSYSGSYNCQGQGHGYQCHTIQY